MKHFIVVQIKVTNPKWIPDYLKNVIPMVKQYQGKYLTQSSKVEMREGEGAPPRFSLIMEFPSKQAFDEFYTCEAYQPYKKARESGAITQMLVIPEEGAG